MKETFDQLKQIFPPMPEACDRALTAAVQSVTERREKPAPRLGRLALLAACMLAVTGVAAAALYPQIVTLFSGRFGQAYGAWMAQGSVAAPQAGVTCGGAVFTVRFYKSNALLDYSYPFENNEPVIEFSYS